MQVLNKQLPAAVYLPFVNQSMRNYAVLHIVAEETKIFKTKERCPLLLCIEVYRPTEIALEKIPDIVTMKNQIDDRGRPNKGGIRTNSAVESEFDTAKDFLNDSALSDMKEKIKKSLVKSHQNPSHLKRESVEYPFDNFDAYENLAKPGISKAKTKRLSGGGFRPPQQREKGYSMGSVHSRSSGSFVSAAESFNEKNIERKEWELRMKNDKQSKKKFQELRKITNREEQSKEFGELVDVRASDPVRVKNLLHNKKKTESSKRKDRQMKRQSTLQKLNDNYFYKNFAANENEQIAEESAENSSSDEEDKAYRPGRERNSVKMARRNSNRSKSATSHLRPSAEADANYRSFSGMNQVGRMSMASRDDNELEESKHSLMSKRSKGSDLEDLTPEQRKLIAVPKSAGELSPQGDDGVDFFKDRTNYKIFLETSKEQRQRVKKNSPFSNLRTWKLMKVIMKTNDDLRQEAFTMQCISTMD